MEAETSISTWAVTLTYRPGEKGAHFFKYDDVQRFFKRLRRDGHQFRYIITGETGPRSTRRTHYHAIIFWQSPPPALPPSIGYGGGGYIRRDWERWGHGHVVIDPEINFRTVRYVVKYIAKEDGSPTMTRMSLKPAIGATWIAQEAVRRAVLNCPHQYNSFTVQGFKHSLPPMWWKRYQTAVEDQFEHLGKPLFMEHESWENSLSTQGHALKEALTEWSPIAMASRAFAVEMKVEGLQPQWGMLAQTQRGIALYIPPTEEDETEWQFNFSASDTEPQLWEGFSAAPIVSRRQHLPTGVYPLEPWQARHVLRGNLPPLTRAQLVQQWAYLPHALFAASAQRLKEATGLGSSSARRYAIPLSVGKFYGRALDGRP